MQIRPGTNIFPVPHTVGGFNTWDDTHTQEKLFKRLWEAFFLDDAIHTMRRENTDGTSLYLRFHPRYPIRSKARRAALQREASPRLLPPR